MGSGVGEVTQRSNVPLLSSQWMKKQRGPVSK